MTDAYDMRTGNQVIHLASGSIVNIIKVENDQLLIDTFPESFCSTTGLSGIAITNALLEKLSFSNDEEINKWQGHGITITKNNDGFYYGLRIAKTRAKMQYLHQLQNYVADFYTTFKQIEYTLDIEVLSR